MREYKQLSYEEREKLAILRQSKLTLGKIAKELGRSKSTISRELRRNQAPLGEYWPDTAQKMTLKRRKRGCILDRDEALKKFVLEKLCLHYWTPEQMAGWLCKRQKRLREVSHETLYAWIYQPTQRREKLWKFLPRHKAKRGLRRVSRSSVSRIPHRVSIHKRPESVAKGK